jgi:AmmeMemoRadiSam system protein A
LRQPGASFVTLTKNGELRGCIGSLQAHRPLAEDVAANALASALRDPRFPPVLPRELPDIRIEISVLSAPVDFPVKDEADLLQKLQPGVHGLIIEDGMHRATFLPAVWEQLPAPRDFLAHLKHKAGLPLHHWSPTLKCQVYTAQKIA